MGDRGKAVKNGGIAFYTSLRGKMTVHFPENRVVCQYCPYCRNEDSLKRWKCLITGDFLLYPFDCVGNRCPLTQEEGDERQ